MCGIVGGLGLGEWPIEPMVSAITHRGPDHQAHFVEGTLFLGHTRLSILDTSPNGHQPMHSTDGNVVIVFNGEIYNHLDIRQQLPPANYRSTSDTETLLHAYQYWGIDFVKRLNGIFAFALYDRQLETLFVARDRFGVKPCYYICTENYFAFSSELKALLPVLQDASINEKAVANYLAFLWSPGTDTMFKAVSKLEMAHVLRIQVRGGKIQKYDSLFYQIPFDGIYTLESELKLIDQCEELLLRAVERQLLSDVPVGFFLSGGLDSSLIVALARKLHPDRKLSCFTIDAGAEIAEEGFANDLGYAKWVADHVRADLHVVKADIDIVRDFDQMIWHLDEPQADAAPLNVSNICQEARRQGIKVLLGGSAGDDVFSGYRRHQALNFEAWIKFIPVPLAQLLVNLPVSVNMPFWRRLKKVLSETVVPVERRLANYYRWIKEEELTKLFSAPVQERLSGYNPTHFFESYLNEIPTEQSWLNRMLYWEMRSFLVDHNLNYTDKMAMAKGVEVRVPFLDNDLVEFACRLPPRLKMKGSETKYILKKVAERYLPREVIYRPKTGFGAPVRRWISHDLSNVIHEKLSGVRLQQIELFDADAVGSLIRRNKEGAIDASYSIWCLLAIESWLRQFTIKEKSTIETAYTKS